ncbi:hypothetical protein PGT21_014763 [Puccinia graminis f. sp. tritici]|uniref:Uncharacterized protein n=1 Tax=Puccinia graminis f. sp. tritici TaxID=56615 RepID=A0A5B0QXC1_PUCGR|nr:hypothetical protein PGT21_014763 [Puccinia graminis f. sp. tritici]
MSQYCRLTIGWALGKRGTTAESGFGDRSNFLTTARKVHISTPVPEWTFRNCCLVLIIGLSERKGTYIVPQPESPCPHQSCQVKEFFLLVLSPFGLRVQDQ